MKRRRLVSTALNRVESTTFSTHPALPTCAIFSKSSANRLPQSRIDMKGEELSRLHIIFNIKDESTRIGWVEVQ